MDQCGNRGSVPPLPGRQSGAEDRAANTSTRSRCWWRWCCRRRRPMPASTRRRPHCLRSPTRRPRWRRSAKTKVRDLIKTIGLFRTKAKNVVALSRILVEQHGGQVPHSREALEALPGVGRKTANVVLNSPSASRPSRSIPTFSASATAPAWRPARRRSRSSRNWRRWCRRNINRTPTIGLFCTGATLAWRASRCAKNASSRTCANGRAKRSCKNKASRECAYGRLGARSASLVDRSDPKVIFGQAGLSPKAGAAWMKRRDIHRQLQARRRGGQQILARGRGVSRQAAEEAATHARADNRGGHHSVCRCRDAREQFLAPPCRRDLPQADQEPRALPARGRACL